jgi:hypothetical protein
MVACDIVIVTGSMFDPAGKVGLSSLTQSILLGANPRLKEEIASLQGRIEWGVDWDTTWIHFEIPPAGVESAFEIVGRLMVIENISRQPSHSRSMKLSRRDEIFAPYRHGWGRRHLFRADIR